jgi:hypothetical protein
MVPFGGPCNKRKPLPYAALQSKKKQGHASTVRGHPLPEVKYVAHGRSSNCFLIHVGRSTNIHGLSISSPSSLGNGATSWRYDPKFSPSSAGPCAARFTSADEAAIARFQESSQLGGLQVSQNQKVNVDAKRPRSSHCGSSCSGFVGREKNK